MENESTVLNKSMCEKCGVALGFYRSAIPNLCSDCCDKEFSTTSCSENNLKDNVNHPNHYTNHPSGVECITITEHMGFNLGNAIKYIWRADLKNGIEDLKKAQWYVQREIDRVQKKEYQ